MLPAHSGLNSSESRATIVSSSSAIPSDTRPCRTRAPPSPIRPPPPAPRPLRPRGAPPRQGPSRHERRIAMSASDLLHLTRRRDRPVRVHFGQGGFHVHVEQVS